MNTGAYQKYSKSWNAVQQFALCALTATLQNMTVFKHRLQMDPALMQYNLFLLLDNFQAKFKIICTLIPCRDDGASSVMFVPYFIYPHCWSKMNLSLIDQVIWPWVYCCPGWWSIHPAEDVPVLVPYKITSEWTLQKKTALFKRSCRGFNMLNPSIHLILVAHSHIYENRRQINLISMFLDSGRKPHSFLRGNT